ncbi:hypothetical protein TWF192_005169 [Orbilia oligospora]|uniref:Uncharacterized protein n=2 Tax=Orbilia oligospora TaxID=2813651 RepID=A0A6G1M9K6_ORBOL|nr:hypothetical protein TWF191_004516 [Orbilia oligospora]KAF3250729.1 hypothetical protein TWF192_005169 [Orbilia oligospora]
MFVFVISILYFAPVLNALRVIWVPCPSRPNAAGIEPEWPASPSPLTYNLRSLLIELSKKNAMKDIFIRLDPDRLEADFQKIDRWESGQGLRNPYPMDSLRSFYWFVAANKLHCHRNPFSLAKAFSQIFQVEAEPWGLMNAPGSNVDAGGRGGGGNNNGEADNHNLAGVRLQPAQQQDPRDFELIDHHYLVYDSENEADPTFQYFTYGPVKHLSILVHLHADELEQYFDDIIASGQDELEPLLYFEILDLIKDWTQLYYDLDTFMNGVRAFRKSLWMLRNRFAEPEEIKKIAQGKHIAKPFSIKKTLVNCLNRLCDYDGRPRARPNLNN